ncbi:hypothetical protein Fot_37525 [Forsythia ovata]|uniref:Uncharacterized protein n=1 Tax=Forsythia ovata TaxID=205694 RepID=A0ABD1RZU4_9LAMI
MLYKEVNKLCTWTQTLNRLKADEKKFAHQLENVQMVKEDALAKMKVKDDELVLMEARTNSMEDMKKELEMKLTIAKLTVFKAKLLFDTLAKNKERIMAEVKQSEAAIHYRKGGL